MNKLKSTPGNMILSLVGFSVVAGLLLGWVDGQTREAIVRAEKGKLSSAISQVIPAFDNEPASDVDTVWLPDGKYPCIIYHATQGGVPVGAAVQASIQRPRDLAQRPTRGSNMARGVTSLRFAPVMLL